MGDRLRTGILAAAHSAGHVVDMSGPSTMPSLAFEDDPDAQRIRTFSRAAAEEGAIFHPFLNWNLSAAHTTEDIDAAIAAAAAAFLATPIASG